MGLFARDPVRDFWRWFTGNAPKIEQEVRRFTCHDAPPRLAFHELGRRLKAVEPGLVHEIGIDPDGKVELIVSADGLHHRIPFVTGLIDAAPVLPGFRFTAFRPRRVGDVLSIVGLGEVDAECLAYVSRPEGPKLGLTVYVDRAAPQDLREAAAFLKLDADLGEYDVMTGVGSLEVLRHAPPEAKPWSALTAEFDAFRAPLAQA